MDFFGLTELYPSALIPLLCVDWASIIAIFDSVGARINQTNKCIFEPISSEPIISISNAHRAIILTVLESHERVDMRPTKNGEKYGVYIVPPKTRILPRIFIT